MYRSPIITLRENEETAFNVGWLAGHYGQPRDRITAVHMGMETADEIVEWFRGHIRATETDVNERNTTLSKLTEVC